MLELPLATIKPESIIEDIFIEKKLEVSVLRLDKIHPHISGNKWFKLRYYLEDALERRKNILTFGGAYSNHLLATAAACKQLNIECTAVVRGEKPSHPSATLTELTRLGMQLEFISREDYSQKKLPAHLIIEKFLIIPEGGYGREGARGASTIVDCFEGLNFDYICAAVGTGTTLAGLINASGPTTEVIGISVLKNNLQLEQEIAGLLTKNKSFQLFHEFHFGGYAKYDETLIRFMNNFYDKTRVPSDFAYTGKLFYAAIELARKNAFRPHSKVLLIHSGGLQGNSSLKKGTLIF